MRHYFLIVIGAAFVLSRGAPTVAAQLKRCGLWVVLNGVWLGALERHAHTAPSLGACLAWLCGSAAGFMVASALFAGLRARLAHAPTPHACRGLALELITAGLLSLAFMGFSGWTR